MTTSRRMVRGAFGALLLGAALLPALRADAAPQTLGAVAMASEEPTAPGAADTGALASVDLTIDGVTGDVCVLSNITGLSGPIAAAHIHSGPPGVNGPIVVTLPNTASSVTGCAVTTPVQAQAILAAPNSFYFNAHTAASPSGALRGQLTTAMFNATLTGAAEVPGPGDPDGTGTAVLALDSTANRACVLFNVAAVDLPASGAHIHIGAAGVAGPIVVPFTAPGAPIAGSCSAATPAIISAVAANPSGHYANVHTPPFPGGAVRGQLSPRVATGVPSVNVAAASVIATTPTTPTTTLAPATVAPTTLAPTTAAAAVTTLAPPTTTVPSTTVATTIAPTTAPATTAPPAAAAAPAEAVADTPQLTG